MANLPFAAAAGKRLEVVRGDIRDLVTVNGVMRGAEVIFHQAVMRSVPRSVADPPGAAEAAEAAGADPLVVKPCQVRENSDSGAWGSAPIGSEILQRATDSVVAPLRVVEDSSS